MSQSKTLLIVEDDPSANKALTVLARINGWKSHSVMNVHDGLAALASDPTAIILDLMLPDGEGVTILERVRETEASAKVIVTTGSSDEHRLNAVRKLHPEHIIRKPVDCSNLLKILSSYMV